MSDHLLIGTYTERLPHVDGKAKGILGCRFDDGVVGEPSLLAAVRSPSFLEVSADGQRVYAVCETHDFEGEAGGGLAAFRRDPVTGALTPLGRRRTGGGQPCHLAISPSGSHVLVTNYADGSIAVFPLEADGSLGPRTALVQHHGSGPDPVRQPGPHTHMVSFYPWSEHRLLVTDLGIDTVLEYQLRSDGSLVENTSSRIQTAAGAGPRHVMHHPDGRHLFILGELDSTLMLLERNDDGRYSFVETVSTLPPGDHPGSSAAALRISASGRYVFVSNRGSDSDNIAMFRFDSEAEALTLLHCEGSRGQTPRDVVQSPDGRHLLVANQDSDNVAVFEIHEEKGDLEPVGTTDVPTPVCLVFV